VSLPGADELFRRTSEHSESEHREPDPAPPTRPPLAAAPAPAERDDEEDEAVRGAAAAAPSEPDSRRRRGASGRVRHDEKMTVYVTEDELLDIEHARLVLRRTLGGAVDRGRLVRAAVAMALADLDEHGTDSDLVRRLST
jgi:hypothetical protein